MGRPIFHSAITLIHYKSDRVSFKGAAQLHPHIIYVQTYPSPHTRELHMAHPFTTNEHFHRSFLHGHLILGGLSIHSAASKLTTTRVNYFLFHSRMGTKVGEKLDTSIAYLQIKSGLLQQFLSTSFTLYGQYMTKTLVKSMWGDTEPHILTLHGSKNSTWVPTAQGAEDLSIMQLAAQDYRLQQKRTYHDKQSKTILTSRFSLFSG